MPHALPGKVGLVGFSAGGGIALAYAPSWDDQVAVLSAWYPSTRALIKVQSWASHMSVPVVMFAGEADTYQNCCLITKARELADAAGAANAQFELTTYPGTEHDFIVGGANYNPQPYKDALARTVAALKRYLNS